MANGTEETEDVVLAASRMAPADHFEEAFPELLSEEDRREQERAEQEKQLEKALGKLSKGAVTVISNIAKAITNPKLTGAAAEQETARIRAELVNRFSDFLDKF